jgi:hypothetical protein
MPSGLPDSLRLSHGHSAADSLSLRLSAAECGCHALSLRLSAGVTVPPGPGGCHLALALAMWPCRSVSQAGCRLGLFVQVLK